MKRTLAAIAAFVLFLPAVLSLDLETALAASQETAEARSVRSQAELAEALYRTAAHPGDLRVSFDPDYRRASETLPGDAQSSSIELGLSASVPLALSLDAREKAEAARVQAEWAAAELPWTLAALRLKAYGLYADAWAAQEEEALLERELEASEIEFAAARARFEGGTLAYAEFRKAEEAYLSAADDLLHAGMAARVSRLELFIWLGADDDGEALSLEAPEGGTLPRAADLAALAVANDPLVRRYRAELSLLEAELAAARGLPLSIDLRLSGSKDDFSASLSWDQDTARLGAGATWARDLEGAGDASTPWVLAAGVSIALDSGATARLEAASLERELEAARARLEAELARLGVDVRLSYQAWIRASDAVEQARRTLEILQDARSTIEARARIGSATEAERLRASVDADRAAWSLIARSVDSERARLAAALAARHPLEANEVTP